MLVSDYKVVYLLDAERSISELEQVDQVDI
jgi:hypothetical protein